MPTARRWAEAIREAGFPLELDQNFDPETFSGFLPCKYDGVAAGFEYAFDEDNTSSLSPENRKLVADRDLEIAFTTHSRLRDLACAIVAGRVLAHLADGVHWDQEADVLSRGAEVLEFAREQVTDLRAELEKEASQHAAGDDLRPADLSSSRPVDVELEATVVFRGGTLLTVETREPTPQRFNLSLVTEDLPKAEQVRILGLWECRGRPARVRCFSMKSKGFFGKTVERAFDAFGNLQLAPGQVDLKQWVARLGEVEAATRMLLAGGSASVPFLLKAARDKKLPAPTRQLAVRVLGALGAAAASALPVLEKLETDAELGAAVTGAMAQINRKP